MANNHLQITGQIAAISGNANIDLDLGFILKDHAVYVDIAVSAGTVDIDIFVSPDGANWYDTTLGNATQGSGNLSYVINQLCRYVRVAVTDNTATGSVDAKLISKRRDDI